MSKLDLNQLMPQIKTLMGMIKESKPILYQEIMTDPECQEILRESQTRYREKMHRMMGQGMLEWEAHEIAWRDLTNQYSL